MLSQHYPIFWVVRSLCCSHIAIDWGVVRSVGCLHQKTGRRRVFTLHAATLRGRGRAWQRLSLECTETGRLIVVDSNCRQIHAFTKMPKDSSVSPVEAARFVLSRFCPKSLRQFEKSLYLARKSASWQHCFHSCSVSLPFLAGHAPLCSHWLQLLNHCLNHWIT